MWFQKAARARISVGQYNLTRLYESGKQTPVDLVKAYLWMSLSKRSGNPTAALDVKGLKARLSPEELASGDQMIQELKKTIL